MEASGSGSTGGSGTVGVAAPRRVPEQRDCTRCDGKQHLVAEGLGLGKYRCDVCEFVVGFDLDSSQPEFILHRGLASRYTKQSFGPDLLSRERRLAPDHPAGT